MPNHCNNSIHISTTIPFDEFLSRDEKWEYVFSFQKIVPMPWLLTQTIEGWFSKAEIDLYFTKIKITRYEELKNSFMMFLANKLYGYHTWYYWAINTWGTKWDAYDVSVEIEEDIWNGWELNRFYASFDTAWSPPIEFYDKFWAWLIAKDPEATMMCTYYEPGCCIVGTYEDGTDYHETWYNTYYCDELDCDIISDESNELISDVQRDYYSNLITFSEAINQIKSDEDLSSETKAELISELEEYFEV